MKEVTFSLPSMGYLEESPIAKLTLREYLIEEEKGLFSSNKPIQKLISLVGSSITYAEDVNGSSVDPKELDLTSFPYPDFTHALCRLRAVSIEPKFEFSQPCPKCKNLVPFTVILDNEGLDTVFLEPGETIEYTGKLSFGEVTARHILVKNSLSLDNVIAKRRQTEGKDFDGGYVLRMANQIVALNEKKFMSTVDAERWMVKLTRSQRSELTSFLQQNSFGDDLSVVLECDGCGYSGDVMVPITDKEFLFREPRVENKRRRSDR